jgi:hypothetical protein
MARRSASCSRGQQCDAHGTIYALSRAPRMYWCSVHRGNS